MEDLLEEGLVCLFLARQMAKCPGGASPATRQAVCDSLYRIDECARAVRRALDEVGREAQTPEANTL